MAVVPFEPPAWKSVRPGKIAWRESDVDPCHGYNRTMVFSNILIQGQLLYSLGPACDFNAGEYPSEGTGNL